MASMFTTRSRGPRRAHHGPYAVDFFNKNPSSIHTPIRRLLHLGSHPSCLRSRHGHSRVRGRRTSLFSSTANRYHVGGCGSEYHWHWRAPIPTSAIRLCVGSFVFSMDDANLVLSTATHGPRCSKSSSFPCRRAGTGVLTRWLNLKPS